MILLTADAFGVLPPISRLTHDQAAYHFISGYTAKVAGTEIGVKEPSATFSPCFGGPFLVLPPARYAELLAEKLRKHGSRVWLVNTGWTGGPYGIGTRMKLAQTRAIVDAIQKGTRPTGMAKDEDVVYTFCTELLNTKHVSDATFAATKGLLGEKGVVDLMGVMSQTPGKMIALTGVVLALVGLIGSLFLRPRRIWVRARRSEDEDDPGTLVEVAGLDRSGGGDVAPVLAGIVSAVRGTSAPTAEETS